MLLKAIKIAFWELVLNERFKLLKSNYSDVKEIRLLGVLDFIENYLKRGLTCLIILDS